MQTGNRNPLKKHVKAQRSGNSDPSKCYTRSGEQEIMKTLQINGLLLQ